jgi:D-threo-aldose 1-dehydrogenase
MPETFGFSVAKERAHETLKAAFESPVNFLDTTASYGDGETERRIGEVLNELGGMPSVYVISTKATVISRPPTLAGSRCADP